MSNWWKIANSYPELHDRFFDKKLDAPMGGVKPTPEMMESNRKARIDNRAHQLQDNLRIARENGVETTADGYLVLYHATPSAKLIRQSGYFKTGTFFGGDLATAQQYFKSLGGGRRKPELMKVKVDPRTVTHNGYYWIAAEPSPVNELS